MNLNVINKEKQEAANAEQSQSLLVQVFDYITLPTFVINTDHVIVHWNRALEVMSGLSKKEMIGTKDQWRPFYSSPRPCLADLLLDGANDRDVEKYYQNKYAKSKLIEGAYEAEDYFPECGEDGEWLQFSATAMTDDKGETIGAIETFTNISDRKKAEFELLLREKSYRELSITDMLTGLHNTRHFYEKLVEIMENAKRYRHSFTLCFLDLDNFKSLNDNYGHMAGDKVLEVFGKLIQTSLRKLDIGFRYGGEEFAILLPSTDIKGAHLVAERIRQSLQEYQFKLTPDKKVKVTVSIGITAYVRGDDNKSLLERSDNALYKAKKNGRNRIEII